MGHGFLVGRVSGPELFGHDAIVFGAGFFGIVDGSGGDGDFSIEVLHKLTEPMKSGDDLWAARKGTSCFLDDLLVDLVLDDTFVNALEKDVERPSPDVEHPRGPAHNGLHAGLGDVTAERRPHEEDGDVWFWIEEVEVSGELGDLFLGQVFGGVVVLAINSDDDGFVAWLDMEIEQVAVASLPDQFDDQKPSKCVS